MGLHVAKYMDDFGTQAFHRNGLRYFYGDASEQALILFRVSQNTLHSILIQQKLFSEICSPFDVGFLKKVKYQVSFNVSVIYFKRLLDQNIFKQ